jgi:hypothetical protein
MPNVMCIELELDRSDVDERTRKRIAHALVVAIIAALVSSSNIVFVCCRDLAAARLRSAIDYAIANGLPKNKQTTTIDLLICFASSNCKIWHDFDRNVVRTLAASKDAVR